MSGWDRLPVDDVGYIHPRVVLRKSDSALRKWVAEFERVRYGGWRNHDGLWRSALGLDSTRGKHVIDYGCGFGIEALQFARTGNRVTLFDLTAAGVKAAQRVLGVYGYKAAAASSPLPDCDVFYANGSLHHTPDLPAIMESAPAPEARLMVYSDRAWEDKGGPGFWRNMDEVGGYADWYSPESLEAACPGWKLRDATYLTPDGWYLAAVLDR